MPSLNRRVSTLGFVAAISMLAACAGVAPTTAPTAVPATPAPTTSTDYLADVDIGSGRTMHILCLGPVGTGRPTIILEHGLGADLGVWQDVFKSLQSTDRVCAYDRASETTQSKLPDGPRTTADQVADLHALLAAAGIKPPYVLAGHSIGGWNNLVYAGAYPTEVAGVVFVDVRPPAMSRELLAALPPAASGEAQAIHDWRFDLTVFEGDPMQNPEHLDLIKSADEALAAPGFGDLPLIVLTRADVTEDFEGLDPALLAKFMEIGDKLTADLVKLSSAGKLVKVEQTSHDIPVDQPQAVIDAILEVLGKAG